MSNHPVPKSKADRTSSYQEETPVTSTSSHGLATDVKRFLASGPISRIKDQMLGFNKSDSISNSDIWLLGVCYKVSPEYQPDGDPVSSSGFASFVEDFSSRILLTYRKGFDCIADSKYTKDVGWGCTLRSSQMLVAQANVVHRLGRSWRKSMNQKHDKDYVAILQLFGDSSESSFSIHNLLQAGKSYGLAAGSWVGPFAVCRAWEKLIHAKREADHSISPAVYVVSGNEDGGIGGTPCLCIEDVRNHCIQRGAQDEDWWESVILLVPLVLGLDKMNPRYLPLLAATFTFPQSIGIVGGRPGSSTYIVGVQDDKAFYLDPHDAQQIVKIKENDVEADTSSYHCNTLKHFPLDTIDPSLAIGFYCKDKDDFDDLCSRASRLEEDSKGAPLFVVTQTSSQSQYPASYQAESWIKAGGEDCYLDIQKGHGEDDWQLL